MKRKIYDAEGNEIIIHGCVRFIPDRVPPSKRLKGGDRVGCGARLQEFDTAFFSIISSGLMYNPFVWDAVLKDTGGFARSVNAHTCPPHSFTAHIEFTMSPDCFVLKKYGLMRIYARFLDILLHIFDKVTIDEHVRIVSSDGNYENDVHMWAEDEEEFPTLLIELVPTGTTITCMFNYVFHDTPTNTYTESFAKVAAKIEAGEEDVDLDEICRGEEGDPKANEGVCRGDA